MHSSRSAARTGMQQQNTSRATRISFPPTPRFSLPDSTTPPCTRTRSTNQIANLQNTWEHALHALTVAPTEKTSTP